MNMENRSGFNYIELALICLLLFAISPRLQSAPWDSSAQLHYSPQAANKLHSRENLVRQAPYQAHRVHIDNTDYRYQNQTIRVIDNPQILMHTAVKRFPEDVTIQAPQSMPLRSPTTAFNQPIDMVETMFKHSHRLSHDLNLSIWANSLDQNKLSQNSIQRQDGGNKFNNMHLLPLAVAHFSAINPQAVSSPISHKQLALAVKYRLVDTLSLAAGYNYEAQDNIAFDNHKLNRSSAYTKLSYRYSPAWSTWLKAEILDNDGNEYDPLNNPSMLTSDWLKKSYRTQIASNNITLNTDYQTADGLALSANLHRRDDKYRPVPSTSVELTQTRSLGYDISAQYSINNALNLNAYLNQEWYDKQQSATTQFTPSNWSDNEDKSTIIGVGISYQNLLSEHLNLGHLDLGIDYYTWKGQHDDTQVYGWANSDRAPLSRKHNVNIYAKYYLADSMSLRFDWLFEKDPNTHDLNLSSPWDAAPKTSPFSEVIREFNGQYLGLVLRYQM